MQVFRQDNYAYVRQFGSRGKGDGQFNSVTGVCMGSDGTICVADCSNHRVQAFRHDNGTLVGKLGRKGERVGQFRSLSGICSQGGVLFVADSVNHRIQAFPLHLLRM